MEESTAAEPVTPGPAANATPTTPSTPATPLGEIALGTPPPALVLPAAETPFPQATPDTPSSKTPTTPTTQKELPTNFQLKHTLEGHSKAVCSVKWCPNGKWLASCSPDLTIRIWNSEGTLEKVMEDTTNGHTKGISDVTWSHDSQYVASCSDDKTVKVWRLGTGNVVKTLVGHASVVLCVNAHPKQHLLVSGSDDTKIIVWNAEQGKVVKIIQAHAESVSAVTYNKEGTIIASSSYDGTCKLWNADTYELVKVLVNNPAVPVSCVKFAPNGKILLTSMLDNSLKLWNDSGTLVRIYRGHKNADYCLFSSLFVRPAGKYVISGSEDGSVFVWNLQSKQVLQKIENAHSGVVLALDPHPVHNSIATAGMDKVIKIWEL